METRASYILVGGFVIGLVAVAFGIVIWLTRADLDDAPSRYMVYFEGTVSGLSNGSAVQYRGIPVGTVADIQIDPGNVERIQVTLEVKPGTPIKEDTTAQLALQGITGLAFIQLQGGTHDSEPLKRKGDDPLPIIESRQSGLETVLEKAPELFEKAVLLADRLSRAVDEKNLKAVADMLQDLRATAKNLSEQSARIDSMMDDGLATMDIVRSAAQNLNDLTADLKIKSGPIVDETQATMVDARKTLADVRQAVSAFEKVANQANSMLGDNRESIRDFSQGGLYEFSQFVAEARVLVANLTRLSAEIERDPARFFFGDSQKGFEAK